MTGNDDVGRCMTVLIEDDDVRRDDVDGQTDGRDIFAMRCDLSILGV